MLLPESMSDHDEAIIGQAKPLDILCGKQQNFANHQGNILFREWINAFKDEYSTSGKESKMKITKHIVQSLQLQFGSRFIKPAGHGRWKRVSDQAARDKVSHALRFAAKSTAASSVAPKVVESTVDTSEGGAENDARDVHRSLPCQSMLHTESQPMHWAFPPPFHHGYADAFMSHRPIYGANVVPQSYYQSSDHLLKRNEPNLFLPSYQAAGRLGLPSGHEGGMEQLRDHSRIRESMVRSDDNQERPGKRSARDQLPLLEGEKVLSEEATPPTKIDRSNLERADETVRRDSHDAMLDYHSLLQDPVGSIEEDHL
jgi:hypothetical protein